jgi:tRNA (cytidine/uridine-2'-O-)-methyltransferase
MRLVLYQPDIPQNTGTILRLAACLGLGADIVEPCGFVLTDTRLKRAGMDYLSSVDLRRHSSWEAFEARRRDRIVLLTTQAPTNYTAFRFAPGDMLLLGRESEGVPAHVHAAADARVRIPLMAGQRALNIAVAAAMVTGEALRQTGAFPSSPNQPCEETPP